MPPGCLPLEVLQGRPFGRRTEGGSNSMMEWECMGISQEDLEEAASREIKYIWSALLVLVKLHP